jgi:hypothetical protein
LCSARTDASSFLAEAEILSFSVLRFQPLNEQISRDGNTEHGEIETHIFEFNVFTIAGLLVKRRL